MYQKGFAPVPILIGVLIIAFVGGLIYFTKSNSNPSPTYLSTEQSDTTTVQTEDAQMDTNNWRIFNNTKYHYSLKYPPGWGPGINGPVEASISDSAVVESLETCNIKDDLCASILVLPVDNGGKPSLRSTFFYYADNPSEGDKVTKKSNLKIDGENGVTFDYFEKNLNATGGLNRVIITNHKNLQYTIKYLEGKYNGELAKDRSTWKDYKYFEAIMRTFKFTQ